jgi:hypothetical protein
MGKKTRKARDLKNLPPSLQQASESASDNNPYCGMNAGNIKEPVPNLNQAGSEKVIKNENNAWIVLGRDRPASRISGYGGMGGTQCASIDMVVGRMSAVNGGPKSNIFVDPNFETDAARIYISQKTNIDKNFDLAKGGVGMSKAKSGIGIKADAVRIIGREGIKLVTGVDKNNSQGGKIKSTSGIDLIAGNDDSKQKIKGLGLFGEKIDFLQPMVKGDNLVAALIEITDQIGDLASRFDKFAKEQIKINAVAAVHVHSVAPLPKPTEPSLELGSMVMQANIQQFVNCMATDWSQRLNLSNFKNNFLKPYGDRWICSRYNRTT